MLVQQPVPIQTDPRNYLTLIHGIAGIGKTTFGSQIEGHYFFLTEKGTEGVSVYGHPILAWDTPDLNEDKDKTPKGFLQSCGELLQGRKAEGVRQVKMVVVDTIENLIELAGVWICKNRTFPEKGVHHKFDYIDDVPWGKGYKAASQLILGKLNKLMLEGFGVLLISHTAERHVKWAGQDLTKYGPNLTPKTERYIVDACGAVGHFVIDQTTKKDEEGKIVKVEEGRYAFWQPAFLRVAKHRLTAFPEKLELHRDTMWPDYCATFEKTVNGISK